MTLEVLKRTYTDCSRNIHQNGGIDLLSQTTTMMFALVAKKYLDLSTFSDEEKAPLSDLIDMFISQSKDEVDSILARYEDINDDVFQLLMKDTNRLINPYAWMIMVFLWTAMGDEDSAYEGLTKTYALLEKPVDIDASSDFGLTMLWSIMSHILDYDVPF